MTTFTKAQLAERALKDLGLLGAEESPTSADLAHAEETVSSEIDLLSAKGIPIWNGSEESIPNEYLTALSRRIGIALAPSYGLTDPATAQVAMEASEKNLRIIGVKPATGSVAESDYF